MDPLSRILSDRTSLVRERDSHMEKAAMAKEATLDGIFRAIGQAGTSAASTLLELAPYLYVGLPAAGGIAAGALSAKATGPTKQDVDRVAKRVLVSKKKMAKKELEDLVAEFGPDVIGEQAGKEVRLG